MDVEEEKCALCGTPASPGAEYCVACGEKFKREILPAEHHVTPQYQGVAIRFVAQLVDVVILGVIFWILSFTGAGIITIDAATGQVSISPYLGVLIIIDIIIVFLYFTLLEGRNGQTVGKMILKIKVVRKATNSSISYGEAAIRTILRIIDLIPFVAPYLLAAVLIWASEDKQRLGDRVAQTVVVQA